MRSGRTTKSLLLWLRPNGHEGPSVEGALARPKVGRKPEGNSENHGALGANSELPFSFGGLFRIQRPSTVLVSSVVIER